MSNNKESLDVDVMLEKHKKLPYVAVKKFFRCKRVDSSYDDYIQTARIALWDAIKGYDGRRNVPFYAYALEVMKRQLFVYHKKEQCRGMTNTGTWSRDKAKADLFSVMSLTSMMSVDDESECSAQDIVDYRQWIRQRFACNENPKAKITVLVLNELSQQEADILNGIAYHEDVSDVAIRYGVTSRKVSHMRYSVISKARRRFNNLSKPKL